jgi:hypothetical protein
VTRSRRPRRRPAALSRALLGIALLALAVAAVLGIASCSGGDEPVAGPAVAVQDDHLPVDPIEAVPARIDLIASTGVTTTRVDLFWRDIAPQEPARPADPQDPAYDFRRADLIFTSLAERGITPIVSVYNTPAWAAGGRVEGQNPALNTAAPEPEAFGAFMEAVARRYSGEERAAGDVLPAVRHFELWNEPNLSGFLSPQTSGGDRVGLDRYAAMVKAAYPRIKRVSPDSVVIAGVGGPRGLTNDTGTGAFDWLEGLKQRDIPLDAYSQHIYPAAAPLVETDAMPSWSSIDALLEELDGFRPGLPLYITEAGYTTSPTPYRDVFVSEEEQAEYLEQIYGELPQLRDGRVKAVVWFNLQDNAGWPAGLLREDGTQKPSYERFLDAVEAAGERAL